MYGWLWRKLPGGVAEKILSVTLLAAAFLALLFFVVFPWVEPRLPWNDVTITSPRPPSASAAASPAASPTPSAGFPPDGGPSAGSGR